MTSSNDEKTHFEAVKALLPKRYGLHAQVSVYRLRVNGRLSVEMEKSRRYLPTCDRIKVDIDYGIRSDLDNRYRNRIFKERKRDGLFNYQAVVDYITKVLDEHSRLETRRALGQTKAKKNGDRLKALFKSDPLLQSLGMDVRSDPVLNTEHGEVKIAFVEESDYSADDKRTAFEFNTVDGDHFSGKLDLTCISPEQVVALVTILRADKLGLLDMLHLADDSILGPIIKRMTAQGGDE